MTKTDMRLSLRLFSILSYVLLILGPAYPVAWADGAETTEKERHVVAQDESCLSFLIPRPKFVVQEPGTVESFYLVGAEGFHEAVLPPQTVLMSKTGVPIHIRLWNELAEVEHVRFPKAAARLDTDPEAYAIRLTGNEGLITASDRRGLQHGLATLRAGIGRLQDEWVMLRQETCQSLEETHRPLVASAIVDLKFETEVFDALREYKRLLWEAERDAGT